MARIREMQQYGLREEARSLAANLLEMGVSEPSVKQDLPAVLAAIGMLDRAIGENGAVVETDPQLLKTAADQAVLRPEEAPRSFPPIRAEASLVRAALEAAEAGRDEDVLEILKTIGRGSPLSDWRLFVRVPRADRSRSCRGPAATEAVVGRAGLGSALAPRDGDSWFREAARTLKKLLEHYPDDLDALVALVDDYQREGDPLKARPYAQRAANLKPLDRAIGGRLWSNHVAAARVYAVKEEYGPAASPRRSAPAMSTTAGFSAMPK
ncbi:MAG: hypothetical protein GXY83_09575 [Rhodopirellula sp.]|nr:hypothetical protein [Rhodopirellula sp.]